MRASEESSRVSSSPDFLNLRKLLNSVIHRVNGLVDSSRYLGVIVGDSLCGLLLVLVAQDLTLNFRTSA